MKRRIVAAGTTVTALLISGAVTTTASARTPSWLKVRTASTATAYNNGRATVTPRAGAVGSRAITSLRLTAYRGSKRVSSGRSVRLKAGSYRTITSGTYRSFRLVNQTRTRQVLHEGDYTTATCQVTSAAPDGFGGTDSQATCTNPYYPGQPQSEDAFGRPLGEQYTSYFFFDDEYVTQQYVAKVRSYGATRKFTSSKRTLRVRDGGYRKVFTGYNSEDTSNFRAPGSNWRVSYSYSCGTYTNFAIWVRRSNGEYVDLAANDLGTYGSGTAREHGAGRFYLEVETTASDCSWRISIK